MGMLEKIFGRREQPAGLKNAQIFKLLEGYTPAFTTWRGSIYESELIRAALDAWGRHAAKLKPNLRGSAEAELQKRHSGWHVNSKTQDFFRSGKASEATSPHLQAPAATTSSA